MLLVFNKPDREGGGHSPHLKRSSSCSFTGCKVILEKALTPMHMHEYESWRNQMRCSTHFSYQCSAHKNSVLFLCYLLRRGVRDFHQFIQPDSRTSKTWQLIIPSPSLRSLKPFPNDKSQHAPGKYILSCPETNSQWPLVRAFSDKIMTTTWFTTQVSFMPKDRKDNLPLTNTSYSQRLDERIKYLQSIQLITETHDQGYVDDRARENWTWLELAIYEDEHATSPKVKEGVKLVWQSHKNVMGSDKFVW